MERLKALHKREEGAVKQGLTLQQYDLKLEQKTQHEANLKKRKIEATNAAREKTNAARRLAVEQNQKHQQEQQQLRDLEKASQQQYHTISISCHPCLVAPTKMLKLGGRARLDGPNLSCDQVHLARCMDKDKGGYDGYGYGYGYQRISSKSNDQYIQYTCQACNFDVCSSCMAYEVLTSEERAALAAKEEKEKQRARQEQEKRQKEREQQAEAMEWEQERLDALGVKKYEEYDEYEPYNIKITANIQNPVPANKDKQKLKAFFVWRTHIYGKERRYGCGQYHETKEFDSSFNTLKEANSRAVCHFYKDGDNYIGMDLLRGRDYMGNTTDDQVTTSDINGAIQLRILNDDCGDEWKVGVAPAAAINHLLG